MNGEATCSKSGNTIIKEISMSSIISDMIKRCHEFEDELYKFEKRFEKIDN